MTRPRIQSLVGTLVSAALLAGLLIQVPWSAVGSATGWGPVTHGEQSAGADRGSRSTNDTDTGSTSPVAPSTLHVPTWGRDFQVEGDDLDDKGALVPPDDVSTLGWWNGGATAPA